MGISVMSATRLVHLEFWKASANSGQPSCNAFTPCWQLLFSPSHPSNAALPLKNTNKVYRGLAVLRKLYVFHCFRGLG